MVQVWGFKVYNDLIHVKMNLNQIPELNWVTPAACKGHGLSICYDSHTTFICKIMLRFISVGRNNIIIINFIITDHDKNVIK